MGSSSLYPLLFDHSNENPIMYLTEGWGVGGGGWGVGGGGGWGLGGGGHQ